MHRGTQRSTRMKFIEEHQSHVLEYVVRAVVYGDIWPSRILVRSWRDILACDVVSVRI